MPLLVNRAVKTKNGSKSAAKHSAEPQPRAHDAPLPEVRRADASGCRALLASSESWPLGRARPKVTHRAIR
jgi:hypothetical protein